jgi:hypothetical protein
MLPFIWNSHTYRSSLIVQNSKAVYCRLLNCDVEGCFFYTTVIFQPQGLCEKTPQFARAGILNLQGRLATLGKMQYATFLGEFKPTENQKLQ